jgi:uncharacterized protein (TIGR02266 family)
MGAVEQFSGISPEDVAEMRDAQARERERELEAIAFRRASRVELKVAVSGVGEDNFFMGFSENVSDGGVFVATMCPPELGSVVDLAVCVNADQSLFVKGEVRWHRTNEHGEPTGCGVQFHPMSPEQERLLAMLMGSSGKEPLFYDD